MNCEVNGNKQISYTTAELDQSIADTVSNKSRLDQVDADIQNLESTVQDHGTRLGDVETLAADNKDRIDQIEYSVDETNIYAANTWDLIYWADEELDRVIGMNTETMRMDSNIPLTAGAHAGSVDRCARTHKLYVRTAADDHKWIEVVDAVTKKWKKKIPLPQKPRSSGGYNKYRDFMAVSTKTYPWVVLIDATTDTVVFQDGHNTGSPHGNDGGNATGHTVWLDRDHFAFLDRHTPEIKIFKVENDGPPYTVTNTQTISTPTGCHSLRSAEAGLLFSDRVFYAAIEGDSAADVGSQMWKMTFDSTTGQFNTPQVIDFIAETDYAGGTPYGKYGSIHHFGISGDGTLIVVPIANTTPGAKDGTVYLIDTASWTLKTPKFKGGYACGHADFSNQLNKVCITNHKGQYVDIIDLDTNTLGHVKVSDHVEDGTMTQAHANVVSPDGKYFHMMETTEGIFIEIDIENEYITRQTVVGGKPVQTTS